MTFLFSLLWPKQQNATFFVWALIARIVFWEEWLYFFVEEGRAFAQLQLATVQISMFEEDVRRRLTVEEELRVGSPAFDPATARLYPRSFRVP